MNSNGALYDYYFFYDEIDENVNDDKKFEVLQMPLS